VVVNVQPRANQPPTAAAAAAPTTGAAPLAVAFKSANIRDAHGSITSYFWNFGNGVTTPAAAPVYVYEVPGDYVATLTVTDNQGATSTSTVTIRVAGRPNAPPTAAADASPRSGSAPLAVTFSSAGSRDADGSIVGWTWNFGNGVTSSAPNPVHTYTVPGTYTAMLTVTDNAGATSTQAVTITVSAPPAAASTVSVGGLDLSVERFFATLGYARTYVYVVDAEGRPVAGALVVGSWSGIADIGQVSATTDMYGRAAFTSAMFFTRGPLGFAVQNIVKAGSTYDAARNRVSLASAAF
jgi:PKD repeat protein